jgi:hypothetical protein
MDKLGVRGYPTLIAFDGGGKEIDRQVGYPGAESVFGWFRELPDRQVPLDEYLKRADSQPKDGRVQLVAAKRLVAADRAADAKKYFARAERSPDKTIAVGAAWALGRMELDVAQEGARRKLAEKICQKVPTSAEAATALRYLVTLAAPPMPLVEKTLQARLLHDWDDAPALNSLAYLALRAKADKTALKIAARLELLAAKDAGQLDTVAEVHHMNGDSVKAVAIEERAVAMASGRTAEGLRKNLERFKRGQKEPGEDIIQITAPSFAMDKPQVSAAPPPVPASRKVERELGKRLPDECVSSAAGADRLRLYVVAEDKVRVTVAPGTPKTLSACATKVVQSVDIPRGTALLVDVSMVPTPFRDAVDAAVKDAETRCAPSATPGQSVEGVLSGAAGAKPEVVLASGTPALRTCVEKSFSSLRPPARTFRAIKLTFK